jgi:LemA protein
MTTIIVTVAIGVVVVILIGLYNTLVSQRLQVKNGWSQIDVQLKRRHDLIPNLIETARGYMKHERETLESVTKARNQASQSTGIAQQIQAEQGLSAALSKFLMIAENYPDLKANQNFLALQEELTATENKVGFARQFYNDATQKYNTSIESVPSNIIAQMFNFKPFDFFKIENAAEREVPKVQF